MSDHVEKLLLNLSRLHKVDVVYLVAQIVDDLSWLKSLLMEVLTNVNDLCKWPVSHNWYSLQKLLTDPLSFHFLDAQCHLKRRLGADEDF